MAGASFTAKGDWKKLAKLAARIGQLSSFPKKASKVLAEEALGLIHEGFEAGISPDGRRWLKPRSRPGGQPLRDTGRLMNSLTVRSNAQGFIVRTNVKYAATHQYGAVIKAKNAPYLVFPVGGKGGLTGRAKTGKWVRTKQVTIPQRQFLPDDRRRLPTRYTRAFKSALKDLMRETLGRR